MPRTERLRRAFSRMATVGYLGTVASVTAMVLALPLWSAAASGVTDLPLLAMAILALIPASDVAVAITNRLVTHLVGPRPLPRLELVGGVPSDLRTLVVVPTLLADEADIEAQVSLLEVQYLANAEGDLRFALLTDWLDAPSERVPDDEALLAAAAASIDRLNARHGEAPGGGARFLLFHRERRWNAAQGVWMGWERKRGKLHELNALLTWLRRHLHPGHGATLIEAPERRSLRHHARFRHSTASGCRRPPRGDDGAPAEPPGVRRARRKGR